MIPYSARQARIVLTSELSRTFSCFSSKITFDRYVHALIKVVFLLKCRVAPIVRESLLLLSRRSRSVRLLLTRIKTLQRFSISGVPIYPLVTKCRYNTTVILQLLFICYLRHLLHVSHLAPCSNYTSESNCTNCTTASKTCLCVESLTSGLDCGIEPLSNCVATTQRLFVVQRFSLSFA